MQSFIVLGIIPGTNIQTTLNFWVGVAFLLAVYILRGRLWAARSHLRLYLAVRQIAHTIKHCEFSVIA